MATMQRHPEKGLASDTGISQRRKISIDRSDDQVFKVCDCLYCRRIRSVSLSRKHPVLQTSQRISVRINRSHCHIAGMLLFERTRIIRTYRKNKKSDLDTKWLHQIPQTTQNQRIITLSAIDLISPNRRINDLTY